MSLWFTIEDYKHQHQTIGHPLVYIRLIHIWYVIIETNKHHCHIIYIHIYVHYIAHRHDHIPSDLTCNWMIRSQRRLRRRCPVESSARRSGGLHGWYLQPQANFKHMVIACFLNIILQKCVGEHPRARGTGHPTAISFWPAEIILWSGCLFKSGTKCPLSCDLYSH